MNCKRLVATLALALLLPGCVLTSPTVQTVDRYTQPLSDFSYWPAIFDNLPNCLDLELIRITLRAHNHLRLSHSLWLRGVYEILGTPLFDSGSTPIPLHIVEQLHTPARLRATI